VLELAAAVLDRPDFLYAATQGAEGEPPKRRYVSFLASGYFVQRSGWGTGKGYADERFLIFDCGPLGEGGHGHYDLLNVEIYAEGRPLVVDPGRYTYSEEGDNFRRWFKGTAAHNTVCVDGLDQTPYRRGRPGKHVAVGVPGPRLSAPGLDILAGSAVSPCYDTRHTRRILFVGDEYWIVEDRLEAERSHRYDLRWHLSAKALSATELHDEATGPVVIAPGMVLAFAGSEEVSLEPGWVSARYGVKEAAPVVSVRAWGGDARFLTLVDPRRGDRVSRLRIRSDADSSGATIVEVEGPGAARDVVAWSERPTHLSLGSLACTASAAWVRETAAGHPQSFRGVEVTDIGSREAEPDFSSVDPTGWVAWDSGESIRAGTGAEL
jgi:hypothetical protein